MARRVILGAAVVVTIGAATVLVSCEFDDARAAAVFRSIPRTLGSAGKPRSSAFSDH